MAAKAGEGKPAWNIEELKERMKRFGLAVIRLAEKMPRSRAAAVVSNQMVRAGTSAGANYRSACRARSRADFVAKMGIVEEELDETLYWLEVSREAGFLLRADVDSAMREGKELLAIAVSSIRTAKKTS
ncbi:MAG: four helix bundle protein [Planctomycetota bacterium]